VGRWTSRPGKGTPRAAASLRRQHQPVPCGVMLFHVKHGWSRRESPVTRPNSDPFGRIQRSTTANQSTKVMPIRLVSVPERIHACSCKPLQGDVPSLTVMRSWPAIPYRRSRLPAAPQHRRNSRRAARISARHQQPGRRDRGESLECFAELHNHSQLRAYCRAGSGAPEGP